MSSLKFKGKTHKERAQPIERQKWGILEKAKDYKLRAADHREKKKRLKILQEKASARNPDEFSFAMMSTRVDSKGQKVTERGNRALSTDVVKLLKTQDAGYIRTMLQIVRKERKRLEEEILLGGEEARALRDGQEGKKGQHTAFVDDREEQKDWKADEWFGTGEDGLAKAWNRPRRSEPSALEDDDEDLEEKKPSKKQKEADFLKWKEERALQKKRERTHERKITHLEAVKARERDLMTAEERLEQQRAKMNGTIGGVNKDGVKFKIRQRKR